MSVFGDVWDHLNSPDITCTSDGSLGLNHWGVSLGFMIGFLFFNIILNIMLYKRKKYVSDHGGLEKFYGEDDSVHLKACHEQKKYLLRSFVSIMAMTYRKDPFIHYYSSSLAVVGFALLLILFQRYPQNQGAPLALIFSAAAMCIWFYYIMIAKSPVPSEGPDDKKYYMYAPRNVYQDLSAPFIHPLFIFLIQLSLASIYVLAVFDEKFPPCVNDTAAFLLYILATILKTMYYGVEMYHTLGNLREDRKFWTGTYNKLFPEVEGTQQYKLAWASSPPMEGDIPKLSWRVRSIFDVFVNWGLWAILMFFMVIQSANGDLQDFVLNFVAVEFILRLDDYATFGYEGCFCIVNDEDEPPFKLPISELEDVEMRLKEKNKELTDTNEELRTIILEKNEELKTMIVEKNEELRNMILELKDK